MILTLLLASILTLTFNIQPVKASGTIYIRADGSIDPPTANITTTDNVTYTFTGNIDGSIVVERNNIIINGTDYILQGTGSEKGIDLSYRTNITIKNTNIKNFDWGVYLYYSSNNNTISGNNITNNNYDGVHLHDSSNNNTISGNNITNNWHGVLLYYSSNNNMVSGNNITNNNYDGVYLHGSSNNNTISGNNITNNNYGVWLTHSSNNNMVSGNNITNNNYDGVRLHYSSNNTISGNSITNNEYGVRLDYSSNNRFYHNNFINNTYQVYLTDSFNNTWDNGCEGNYWSDYNGTDSDGDGIGDTPYVIDENNTDHCPLMNPYWLPGDVNHDLKIDIYDVVRITGVYGSQQGDPNWNCHSDIAEPYGIINIYDVVTCTKDYRKEYTP